MCVYTERGILTQSSVESLLDRLEADDWAADAVNLSHINSGLRDYLWDHTISTNNNKKWTEDKRTDHKKQMMFAMSCMIGWLIRIGWPGIYVFPIVVLSLFLLSIKHSSEGWKVTSKLRLSYDKSFTQRLARDLGRRKMDTALERRMPWASQTLGLAVVDNFLHKFKTSYEHVEESNHYYQTINWITVPIPAAFVPPEYDPSSERWSLLLNVILKP